jgi:hypothetical protein
MESTGDITQDGAGDVRQGSLIVYVRNTQLAACLVAIGVRLRKDPPYTKKEMGNGDVVTTWNFEAKTPDGGINTLDMLKAWKDDVAFGEKNPTHPFTFAMHAVKNYRQMVEHVHNQQPWVAYVSETGMHTIWVIKDSAKARECVALGLSRTGDHAEVDQHTS